MDNNNVIYKVL